MMAGGGGHQVTGDTARSLCLIAIVALNLI